MNLLCKITNRRLCPWGPWKTTEVAYLDRGEQRTVLLERRMCTECGASQERDAPSTETELRRTA